MSCRAAAIRTAARSVACCAARNRSGNLNHFHAKRRKFRIGLTAQIDNAREPGISRGDGGDDRPLDRRRDNETGGLVGSWTAGEGGEHRAVPLMHVGDVGQRRPDLRRKGAGANQGNNAAATHVTRHLTPVCARTQALQMLGTNLARIGEDSLRKTTNVVVPGSDLFDEGLELPHDLRLTGQRRTQAAHDFEQQRVRGRVFEPVDVWREIERIVSVDEADVSDAGPPDGRVSERRQAPGRTMEDLQAHAPNFMKRPSEVCHGFVCRLGAGRRVL